MEHLYVFLAAATTFLAVSKLMPKTRHELLVIKHNRNNVIHVDFKAKRKVS